MRSIVAIALNTFREAIRSRILYIVLIFALLLMASSGIVSDLAISAHSRIVRDFGLACISFFGLAIAILVGIGLVYNEMDKKSIYTMVSKPIDRWQFLLGKYFGLLLTIYVNIAIMAVFFLAVLNYQDQTTDEMWDEVMYVQEGDDYLLVEHPFLTSTGHIVKSAIRGVGMGLANLAGFKAIDTTRHINIVVFFIAMELAIITAFAILYSSFSTPTLSAIFTVLTFVAGRLNVSIWAYAEKIGSSQEAMATVGGNIRYLLAMLAYMIVPNLSAYKVEMLALDETTPEHINALFGSGPDIWFNVLYFCCYTALILGISITIFRSRNFK